MIRDIYNKEIDTPSRLWNAIGYFEINQSSQGKDVKMAPHDGPTRWPTRTRARKRQERYELFEYMENMHQNRGNERADEVLSQRGCD